jgi:hypothetical protein
VKGRFANTNSPYNLTRILRLDLPIIAARTLGGLMQKTHSDLGKVLTQILRLRRVKKLIR